jgi:hypothetical protein
MSGTLTLQAFQHDMIGLYATRMADSPAHRVINANLKVLRKYGSFGTDTVHIAGSNMPGHGRLAEPDNHDRPAVASAGRLSGRKAVWRF